MTAADENSTKDQENKSDSVDAETEGLISLEDLDKVINEQDPSFRSEIETIASQENAADLNIELIDLDRLLAEQEEQSLRSRAKRLMRKLKNFLMGLRTTAIYFLQNELPLLLKNGKEGVRGFFGWISEVLRQFGFKPLRFKLMVFGFAFLCLGTAAVLFLMLTKGIVPEQERLFVQSLDSISDRRWSYDPKTEQEPFYGSVRSAQNMMIVPKLVVNVKRSLNSGRNPMAAAELYIEGMSPDVVVEIKDRETEFRDRFMRMMEEFSYDELMAAQGKIRLQEALVREANQLATKGRIRRIYFKTIVLKP